MQDYSKGIDEPFIQDQRQRIEQAIVPAMAALYDHDRPIFDESFRPGLKYMEKVVSYFDYWACGVSILAVLAGRGDAPAMALVRKVMANTDYYLQHIYQKPLPDGQVFRTPPRRLLHHLGLAFAALKGRLEARERDWFARTVERVMPDVLEHNRQFLPGERDLHLTWANNHTAIFMQGLWTCGQVFDRPEWARIAGEFAERFYESGHPDGYWEENTNAQREGGPSLVYTRLTAGCLYDVLDGRGDPRDKFIRAGDFYRGFLNDDSEMIPLADERTNSSGRPGGYGLALHSLTDRGRGFLREVLSETDHAAQTPEMLAVTYRELELMATGPGDVPENHTDGACRITLPLGIVRRDGFTAGLSALRALNREIRPDSDYALDHQNLLYLAHRRAGVILPATKSKRDPRFSTFRIGDDAYPARTGALRLGDGWAEADLHYETFSARVRWDIADRAALTLQTDDPREVITSLLIAQPERLRSDTPHELAELPGFSPYSQGNLETTHTAAIFRWRHALRVEFDA